MRKYVFVVLAGAALDLAFAQGPAKPRVIGISQITVRAHDLNASRHFYGDLLGFYEAIDVLKNHTVSPNTGLAQSEVLEVFFKVNNRQYIVVAPEISPEQPRLASYAIETEDAEAMRVWIKSLGYKTPDAVQKTASGNIEFDVDDPEGLTITILQYTRESVSVRDAGRFLSPNRLTTRIIHTGYTVTRPETVKFYQDVFAVREFWRADPTMFAPGRGPGLPSVAQGLLRASLSNLKLGTSDDYIEWSFARGKDGALAQPTRAGGHIALLTADMAKTMATLESRLAFQDYKKQHESHIGVNHKWQGNWFDPDGTRTEYMEHDTADGLPSPISRAPYFP
jgi:lactoylglutathione lyase